MCVPSVNSRWKSGVNGAAVGLGSWRRSQPRPQPATGTASARKRSTSPPTVTTAATCCGGSYSRGTSAKVNAFYNWHVQEWRVYVWFSARVGGGWSIGDHRCSRGPGCFVPRQHPVNPPTSPFWYGMDHTGFSYCHFRNVRKIVLTSF